VFSCRDLPGRPTPGGATLPDLERFETEDAELGTAGVIGLHDRPR
jgi:hypothetical protein